MFYVKRNLPPPAYPSLYLSIFSFSSIKFCQRFFRNATARILIFGTNIENDLYFVVRRTLPLLVIPFVCPFFHPLSLNVLFFKISQEPQQLWFWFRYNCLDSLVVLFKSDLPPPAYNSFVCPYSFLFNKTFVSFFFQLCTNVGNEWLHCVRENQLPAVYESLYLSNYLSLKINFLSQIPWHLWEVQSISWEGTIIYCGKENQDYEFTSNFGRLLFLMFTFFSSLTHWLLYS